MRHLYSQHIMCRKSKKKLHIRMSVKTMEVGNLLKKKKKETLFILSQEWLTSDIFAKFDSVLSQCTCFPQLWSPEGNLPLSQFKLYFLKTYYTSAEVELQNLMSMTWTSCGNLNLQGLLFKGWIHEHLDIKWNFLSLMPVSQLQQY